MINFEMSNYPTEEGKKLRLEVFVKEQGFEEEFDQFDRLDMAYHFVLFEDGEALATCRMNKEQEGVYHIGRVAVKKEHRKRGLGAKVIAEAEDAALSMGGHTITIGAQTQALGFYIALGYVAQGDEYIEEGKPHVKVIKQL